MAAAVSYAASIANAERVVLIVQSRVSTCLAFCRDENGMHPCALFWLGLVSPIWENKYCCCLGGGKEHCKTKNPPQSSWVQQCILVRRKQTTVRRKYQSPRVELVQCTSNKRITLCSVHRFPHDGGGVPPLDEMNRKNNRMTYEQGNSQLLYVLWVLI